MWNVWWIYCCSPWYHISLATPSGDCRENSPCIVLRQLQMKTKRQFSLLKIREEDLLLFLSKLLSLSFSSLCENESHSVLSDSVTRWTVACQLPLSMDFSRPEYWSGLLFPSPGEFSQPSDWTQVSQIYVLQYNGWTISASLTTLESFLQDLGAIFWNTNIQGDITPNFQFLWVEGP